MIHVRRPGIPGNLAGVSEYEFWFVDSAPAATVISSGTDPAQGEGSFIPERADCPLSTWSTGAAGECPPGKSIDGDRERLLP